MNKCNNCNAVFFEPKRIKTTYEEEYGVGHLFDSRTLNHYEKECCPNCLSTEFEEVIEEEEDERR